MQTSTIYLQHAINFEPLKQMLLPHSNCTNQISTHIALLKSVNNVTIAILLCNISDTEKAKVTIPSISTIYKYHKYHSALQKLIIL